MAGQTLRIRAGEVVSVAVGFSLGEGPAAGGEVSFINGAQLPMTVFDLKMRRIIYVAGSHAMAARLAGLLSAC